MAMELVNDPEPDLDELIYLVGGCNSVSWLSALDFYSPMTDVIKSLKPINHGRAYVSIAWLNGKLYVFGGGNGSLWVNTGATLNNIIFAMGGANGVDCYADVEIFDLDVGYWISSRSMLQKSLMVQSMPLVDMIERNI
ncbi:Ring canal kelch protein [Camellia lanceoleosa]|nr:Ring canal kelch protein [Camellia lanceoleosa]